MLTRIYVLYLRSDAFTNGDDPVLVRVEAHADLAHWLWICHRCGEVALPIQLLYRPFHWLGLLAVLHRLPRG
jgi:hypothetical protein